MCFFSLIEDPKVYPKIRPKFKTDVLDLREVEGRER